MKKFTFIFALLFPILAQAQVGPVRWRVDANISGGSPSLGTSAQSAYIGLFDGGLTLTNNSGSGTKVITAQIPCSSTNAPSGTTCSAGTESIGVAFTPPGGWKGDARACVEFGHEMGNSSSSAIITTFQIVETACNAQVVTQEGKSRVPSAAAANGAAFTVYLPVRVCGTFTFSTGGSQRCLRLMYEQAITATPSSNLIKADANTSVGNRDVHWEVYPLNN